jgi:phosphatidylinositol 4-kinase
MLIQNQVAQGNLSPADAAKVLQYTSLNSINAANTSSSVHDESKRVDKSDHPIIDAGDVDPRLVGCGPLPPAVLQALTLWKGGMVTHAELLELVKKDIEFVKHSILVDAENLNMLQENSAFWGRFAFGERWAEKKSRIGSSSPKSATTGWDLMGVIVKSNDDLRQEAFVMQLIELCQEAFELAELELWISPYRILATGRTTGVIECVRNAMSFDALKKRPGYGKGGLREHLHRMTEFTADPGGSFKSAQQNFVRSLAAYSLLSYIFQFKDRHNGNLLLDTAGHVIHIDFGFVFGIAPGGSFSLEMSTPFKLTEEMLDVMGGLRSPLFSEFVTLFCCGYLALQAHCETFLTLVEITSRDSTFKCFDGRDTDEIVAKLRERFNPDFSKEETVSFALDLIKQATTSYGTRQYDIYQYLSQGIY